MWKSELFFSLINSLYFMWKSESLGEQCGSMLHSGGSGSKMFFGIGLCFTHGTNLNHIINK